MGFPGVDRCFYAIHLEADLTRDEWRTPLGNRPYYPGKRPPYRPDAKCYTQGIPDLNGPAAAKSETTR